MYNQASVTQRLGARLAERTGTLPSVAIHSSTEVQPGIFQLVVAHTSDAGPKLNREALEKTLKGHASVIAGSFRRISGKSQTRLLSVGYVQANVESEPLTEKRQTAMTVVAKNVLLDAHDQSLWNVVTSDTGAKFIRRQDNENVTELLSAMASATPVRFDVPAPESINQYIGASLDYVGYVDADTGTMKYGFVAQAGEEESQVLPRGSDELVTVANSLVVSRATNVDSDDFLESAVTRETAALKDPEKMKGYYRKMYAYDPKYLEQVEKQISNQATL